MSLTHHFSSVFSRLRRQPGALLRIVLVSCMIALGAAVAHSGFYGASKGLQELSEQIVIKVFLSIPSSADDVRRITNRITSIQEIESVEVTSSEDALSEFVAKFGRPSENLMPANPFPVTITATVKAKFRTTTTLNSITAKCRAIAGVEDAQFRTTFVQAVNDRMRRSTAIWLSAGIVIIIVFFAMLHYTIKQHGSVDRTKAQVLSLMGARRTFITAPDVVFNSFAIVLGLSVGIGIIALLQNQLADHAPWVKSIQTQTILPFFGIVTAVSLFIAALTSWRQSMYKAVQ